MLHEGKGKGNEREKKVLLFSHTFSQCSSIQGHVQKRENERFLSSSRLVHARTRTRRGTCGTHSRARNEEWNVRSSGCMHTRNCSRERKPRNSNLFSAEKSVENATFLPGKRKGFLCFYKVAKLQMGKRRFEHKSDLIWMRQKARKFKGKITYIFFCFERCMRAVKFWRKKALLSFRKHPHLLCGRI